MKLLTTIFIILISISGQSQQNSVYKDKFIPNYLLKPDIIADEGSARLVAQIDKKNNKIITRLINQSDSTLYASGDGHRINIGLMIKNKHGQWQEVRFQEATSCVTAKHPIPSHYHTRHHLDPKKIKGNHETEICFSSFIGRKLVRSNPIRYKVDTTLFYSVNQRKIWSIEKFCDSANLNREDIIKNKLHLVGLHFNETHDYDKIEGLCQDILTLVPNYSVALVRLHQAQYYRALNAMSQPISDFDKSLIASNSINHLRSIPDTDPQYTIVRSEMKKLRTMLLSKDQFKNEIRKTCLEKDNDVFCYVGYGIDDMVKMHFKE